MNGNKADKRKLIGSEKNWNKFGELRGEQRTKKYER